MSALFRKTEKKAEKEVVKEKPVVKVEEKKVKPIKSDFIKQGWRSVKAPHITEKAGFLEGKNQFVFKVFDNANKNEIKKSIEEIYRVDVTNVNIINVRPKKGEREGSKGRNQDTRKQSCH